MSNKTRKRIWPVSLAAAIGVVAMVAVLAATVWTTGTAQAQAPFLGPGNVTATAVSATQVNLTWTAGVGQNSYKVERKTGSGAYSIAAENLTATSYSDTGLTASTTYTYKVSGVNTFGSTVGSPAEVSAMTMASGGGVTPMPATGDMHQVGQHHGQRLPGAQADHRQFGHGPGRAQLHRGVPGGRLR